MTATPGRILVVGAGVFGATAALELRRRGWAVTLVDRGPLPHPDASSTDVSKMIRMDYGSDVFYHELAEEALDGWDRWNVDWRRPLYHDDGFLVLAARPMAPGGFEYESYQTLRRRGYAPRRIGGSALERRCPAWVGGRYPDGYLSPRGGWAESGAVVSRLLELCRGAGVDEVRGVAEGIVSSGSRVRGVRVRPANGGAGETLKADRVVVAAGAWTPALLPWTADLLTSVAQPILHFGVEDPGAWRAPRFPPFAADIAGSGWYGFPALDDGRVKLGHHGPGRPATPENRGEVTAAHETRARTFFADALPALADAPLVGRRMCMYCDSRDGDLLVDGAPTRQGLVVASGGSGHAFKFAPVLGGIVADAVEGRGGRWSERFRWRRPHRARKEEARLLRAEDRTEEEP